MKNIIWCATEANVLDGKKRIGLSVIFSALKDLNNPHKSLEKHVIHVAGTNGKGSTVNYIKTILEKKGYKVGVFTSPHLVEYNERIYADGRFITDEKIEKYKNLVITKCKNFKKISFFELSTLIAILFFFDLQKKQKLKYFIFETGLGGRLDATNIFQKPLVSVITSISFDHMDKLGNTLKKIAYEKGGIIKSETPVFTSNVNKNVVNVLQNIALNKKANLFSLNKDFFLDKNLKPSLPGDHQIVNATLASEVCKYIGIDYESIQSGIATTEWRGRLQRVFLKELDEKKLNISDIYLDGAHNKDGIRVLCNFIKQFRKNFYSKNKSKPLTVIGIFACLKRKKYQSFFPLLKKVSFDKMLFLNVPEGIDNFVSQTELLKLGQDYKINCDTVQSFKEVKNYIDKTKNNVIFIFGSLYFIGWILENHIRN